VPRINFINTGGHFASGSVVYEIMTGSPPYTGAEINARYKKSEFPDAASLREIGAIIKKCWFAQYAGFKAVVQDVREVPDV
jgi:hypothetical protein